VVHILEATTGGTRKHLRDLVTRLDKSRFDVDAICSPLRDPHFVADVSAMRAAGAQVYLVPMRRQISPIRDYVAYGRLRKLLRDGKYDIAHAHSAKAGVLGRYAARAAGVPRIVYTPHGFPFAMWVGAGRQALYRVLERRAAAVTDRIIAVSEGDRQAALDAALCDPDKVTVIENGIDLAEFDAALAQPVSRASLGLDEDDAVIGFFGRLCRQKEPGILVTALPYIRDEIPKAKLLLVGDGELRSHTERLAERCGVRDSVVFAGHREDAAGLYPAIDVLAVPSLWEAAPYVLLEAMSGRKPVAASDIPGCRDIVRDGETGRLFLPGDLRTTVKALCQILTLPDRGRRMGERGRALVEERYTLQRCLNKTQELYLQLAGEATAP
jgi:glycosyltransferase involved in cell wall biosynthesis